MLVIKPVPYFKILRPLQWLKNLMIYFPPFLGGVLLQPGLAMRGVLPLFAFCMASSATYILNDISDRQTDGCHPDKKERPLPSGKVSVSGATLLALILGVFAVVSAYSISITFLLYLVAYVLLSAVYTCCLKKYALIDIFCISAGFLLRLEAGGAVFDIRISEWLFLSVFLLSIFLSTGKRLAEKSRLGGNAADHRQALNAYPDGYLEGAMYMTGGAVLVTYTMYVISRHSDSLLYSVPLCCFGLMRYILRVQSGSGGDPTESLTRDLPLFIVGLLWVLMVGWGIYGG